MVTRVIAIGGAVVVLLLAVIGFFVFRTPEQASGPITAIPIATSAPVAAPAATDAPTAAPTTAPTDAAPAPTVAAEATAAPAATEAPTAAAATTLLFEIVPAESQARFLIDEVLRGDPITVLGVTDQIAGQISVDTSTPANTQVGVIQINARTLTTDNDFRNRAIKNAILRTNDFEFVTFTPTAITGLPTTIAIGQPLTFQITGDLTVTDVTRPVTFEVTVTPDSESQLKGLAKATILYRDFNLAIPDAQAVDTVADEVRLELEFTARRVG